jgi:hypothetical protein
VKLVNISGTKRMKTRELKLIKLKPTVRSNYINKKLHNKKLNVPYSSPNSIRVIKSRRIRWNGHVARMGERRDACKLLVRKPEEKRPNGRHRRRLEGNIKMDLQELGIGV